MAEDYYYAGDVEAQRWRKERHDRIALCMGWVLLTVGLLGAMITILLGIALLYNDEVAPAPVIVPVSFDNPV